MLMCRCCFCKLPKMRLLFCLVLVIGSFFYAHAQEFLPVDSAFQRALDNQTRTLTGEPGPNYWQNKAEYTIVVQYEPESLLLDGKVDMVYFNNSPDTLSEIWFKLYPNLYQKGAPAASESRIAKRDQGDGVQIEQLKINGKKIAAHHYSIDGTNMVLPLASPLLPGKDMRMSIDYHYFVNEGSHNRTGKVDDGVAFVAYFFPRVAVYDDIDGWNKYPYRGSEEFYNDFCDFDVFVTVPKGQVVWATGDLMNAHKVFHDTIAGRLRRAEKEDGIIDVIHEEDLKARNVTKGRESLTYHYKADNVVDFAFGLSDHYTWKSSSVVVDSVTGRRTRVDAVFDPAHADYEEVIDFARSTVYFMSHVFPRWPFPYPHMTVFDGLDQMEYPMMANDNPTDTREDGITLTSHEIFHTLFPFYMGINETKFAWMDEGWATLGEWEISRMIDTAYLDDYGVKPTAVTSGRKDDTPIMTLTTDLKGAGTFTNSYPKPAFGYLFVKEHLGDSLFYEALHHYIRAWNGRHPQPLDFFNSMNTGSGQDLNWFWKRWFYAEGVTDLAINDVIKTANGYRIIIENKSTKPLPVHLTLSYKDGILTQQKHSIGVWKEDDREVSIYVETDKPLAKVELGSDYVPDKNMKDNTFVLDAK